MNFRIWIENQSQILPIASLVMTKSELEAAINNIVRGYPAMTDGPVEVAYLTRSRKYHLLNGYHRMVAYLMAGKTNVQATITPASFRLPPPKDRFLFQPNLPYKGLEDFIEPYILRKL